MFQAAVSAASPVQPVCLMYEDAQGRQSTAPAYIDDLTLAESLDALLRGAPMTAHVYVGEALAPGADRRTLAAQAEQAIGAALLRLQQDGRAGVTGRSGSTTSSETTLPAEAPMINRADQPGRSA
ncbi:MAG TPA: 1-acyl-sn-glycerol-3-phosphate acyltransferase, partial [Paraburkholderia sp.]